MTALRVFITGASSGLGAALARHYALQGAQLGLVARNADKLAAFANEFPGCVIYPLDVRDQVAMQAAAADFMARFGVPDVVIAAAGISVGTLTEHATDLEVFQAVMDINVIGMVTTFQPFVAAMRHARSGVLAGIASVAGIRGLPGGAAYSASKAAVIYLPGIATGGAPQQRRRSVYGQPRLHRHAYDCGESISHALYPASRRGRRKNCPRHRAAAALCHLALANGAGRMGSGFSAARSIRPACSAAPPASCVICRCESH